MQKNKKTNRWRQYFDEKSARFGPSYKANDYSDDKAYQSIQIVTRDIIQKYGRKDGLAVDIGCGNGVLLGNQTGAYQIVGIDHSLSALRHAHQQGLKSVQSDATVLPLKENITDICFSIGMLQYLSREGLDLLFKEMRRITTPKGYIIVSTLNPDSILRKAYGLVHNDTGSNFESMFSIKDISIHLGRIGIEVIEYYYFYTPSRYWHMKTAPNFVYNFFSSTYLLVGKST